jgi:hypothetical protein
MDRHLRAALAAAALAAACATAPPAPPPLAAAAPAPPPVAPPLPAGVAALDEAARLLADGADLPLVARLLEAAGDGDPRRDLLAGQLAELLGDDEAAAAAYQRFLSGVDDDEVRLRRALALERLGRAGEVREDLARLRPPARAEQPAPSRRKLRPLLPSAR